MKIKTITEDSLEIEQVDHAYNYQLFLTEKLDNFNSNFDQNILNEIVLWKVSRYAYFNNETLEKLNSIDSNAQTLPESLKKSILMQLLNITGVSLPMASTILRFKNKNVFQIIDQRVYRLLYGCPLKVYNRTEKNKSEAIEKYFKYLEKLQEVCNLKGISFSESDRILYMMDIRVNGEIKIH